MPATVPNLFAIPFEFDVSLVLNAHLLVMKARYINLFTDFGFKKIFGEEVSKPILLDFLNALLPVQSRIQSLSFKNAEHLGRTESDRKSLFDIYCEAENGEKFIVELQKAKQNFFKDRTVYYSTFPIREQAEKGTWDYNLKPVFCVGILDFTFDDYETEPEKSEVVHTIKLKNQHGKTFYEKLTYIYLEMPNFKKAEDELTSRLDEWLFLIRHLEDFQTVPPIYEDDHIFRAVLEKAEIAGFNSWEYESYERSLREFRDMKGYMDTAFDEGKMEGKIEGILEGRKEIAKQMFAENVPMEIMMRYTGLSEDEIKALSQ